jgi:hypothetical protein
MMTSEGTNNNNNNTGLPLFSSSLTPALHPLSSSPATNLFFPTGTSVPLTDDVTTIFVVGFPDDMTEREFQNMFMFCRGFEAASLKWHCKDQEDDTLVGSNSGKKQMVSVVSEQGGGLTKKNELIWLDLILSRLGLRNSGLDWKPWRRWISLVGKRSTKIKGRCSRRRWQRRISMLNVALWLLLPMSSFPLHPCYNNTSRPHQPLPLLWVLALLLQQQQPKQWKLAIMCRQWNQPLF